MTSKVICTISITIPKQKDKQVQFKCTSYRKEELQDYIKRHRPEIEKIAYNESDVTICINEQHDLED